MNKSRDNSTKRVNVPMPPSCDLIDDNLWLGNLSAATDLDLLDKLHINHILTIDSVPLPHKVTDRNDIKFMFLKLTDMATENIIAYFLKAFHFISNGVKNGVVLVHCYFGVSRSATLVIAYLMKSHNMSYEKAYEYLQSKRSCANPNSGFRGQLRLFEMMEYEIKTENIVYRMFRLSIAAELIKKVKILPQNYLDVISSDPAVVQSKPNSSGFCCRKCRRMVALTRNIVPHFPGRKYTWNLETSTIDFNNICHKIHFIEPIAWMKNVTQQLEGKLYCGKCKSKLGSFSWIMGCQCPCGSKVKPAFYLVPSKVDLVNIVINVQATI